MKIIAVDADCEALALLESSLKSVFVGAEVISFTNALESFLYVKSHAEKIALIYFPLTMRPFDGFKYYELIKLLAFSGKLILTTQTDSSEIRELINLNGANRYIQKPVTEEKIRELAMLEQEICLDDYDVRADGYCSACVYHWCESRKFSEDHS